MSKKQSNPDPPPPTCGSINIQAKEHIGELTINVSITGLRVARFRLKIGAWFVGLGCKIAGTKCNINVMDCLPELKDTDCPPMPQCKPPKE